MEITLVDVLQEIKSLRAEMNQRFKEQEERIDKKMDQRFKEQDEKIDQRFEEQKKKLKEEINQRFEEQDKIIIQTKQMLMQHIKEQIEISTKEIAEELRQIVAYIEKKERKQLKRNEQIEEELKNNKISHKAYDTRLYKIECVQSNLESKVLELNNN